MDIHAVRNQDSITNRDRVCRPDTATLSDKAIVTYTYLSAMPKYEKLTTYMALAAYLNHIFPLLVVPDATSWVQAGSITYQTELLHVMLFDALRQPAGRPNDPKRNS